MAARVEELKDDFLTCPLCLQLFTEPKLLSCQHTFCLGCLKQYIAHNSFPFSQCVCPICKESATVPDGDATKLKNNFLVVGLLQFVKGNTSENAQSMDQRLPKQPPGAECPLCEETRACADYCLKCQMWLCETCKRSHSKVPATKDHSIRSLHDLHANGLEKLKQVEKSIHGLLEETDSRQSVIFHQRQVLADQMSEATYTINAATTRLKDVVEDMQQQLLSQLCARIMKGDDALSKALTGVESRKNQLDKAKSRVKDARGSDDLGQGLSLVSDLEQDLRHLTPLPDVPVEATVVSFCSAPLLLNSLQADMLGHIAILDDVASAKCLHFPAGDNTLHFTAIADVQLSLDVHLVTSMVAYGAAPEKVIFVSGNNMVYCCPPRLQFGVPVFQFCDKSVFQKPWSVAMTSDKKVLVTDAGSSCGEGFVAVCDLNGKFLRYLAKGLSLPRGIAVDSSGLVYVCDQDDRCVYVLDYSHNGSLKKVMKKDSDGKFLFLSPMDIAVAGNGDIMVSDAGQFIKIFSSNFTLQKTYQSRLPKSEFWGVCTDPGGSVYVADWKYGIHVLSNTSDAKFEGLLKGVESAGIVEPTAVAFNLDSAALLVGNSSSQIYRSAFV